MDAATCCIDIVDPASAPAHRILWSFMDDVVSRGRPATDGETATELRNSPSDDLALPNGLFLLAHQNDEVLGCAGLRLLGPGPVLGPGLLEEPGRVGEVTRVFVAHAARGRGLGIRLMAELERLARDRGLSALRLDTRADLTEARHLYARLGYEEVARCSSPHADHLLAKTLASSWSCPPRGITAGTPMCRSRCEALTLLRRAGTPAR